MKWHGLGMVRYTSACINTASTVCRLANTRLSLSSLIMGGAFYDGTMNGTGTGPAGTTARMPLSMLCAKHCWSQSLMGQPRIRERPQKAQKRTQEAHKETF